MRKKIGILMENRFIENEIAYYQSRFAEEGFEVVLLTRLWGQPQLTFKGIAYQAEVPVHHSFEDIAARDLEEYAAIISPAGYVSDYLLYTEKPYGVSPAAAFIEKIMKDKKIVKGFICHSLWIAGPVKKAFEGRVVTCHNNIISHVKNAGITYVNQDVRIDEDLVTARTGNDYALFAKTIIDCIYKRKEKASMYEKSIVLRDKIRKQKTANGVLMQNLGVGKLMNALHWNMEDKSIVEWHKHPAEQFGYCIKGGFKIFYDDGNVKEEYEIHAGDCYFIPPEVLHKFIALGETEAIDVFNPIKYDIPKEIN